MGELMIFDSEQERVNYERALKRFIEKCDYDEQTGCVLWTGAAHHFRNGKDQYGGFSFEGKKWLAHRWAAIYIHEMNVIDMTVNHCCPTGPNTKCVHHLEPMTLVENVMEMHYRKAAESRVDIGNKERQFHLILDRAEEEYIREAPDIGFSAAYPDAPVWYDNLKRKYG